MQEKIVKILESYETLDENGNEYIKPKHYNGLAYEILKAINYTRCCTELRKKNKPVDGGTSYATLGRTKGKSDM